ncbi:MAG TPA: aminotransferase class III-fold pyridoxal phosphate-dependent enzyme, partial [Hyphomicrobiales bacterium]|nr:aminotransferase class III-fold pyridoxal phosphate-dependent enzyme [Hyphomicrobiales bacterium]
IVDDIQAGVGRTGTFFSFEPARLKPDIVTMAKSVSGYGLPLALVLIDRQFDEWAPGEHNGTFRGNCNAFVTARAALERFWRGAEFEAAIGAAGKLLEERLTRIAKRYGRKRMSVKGRGMMRGLDIKSGDIAEQIVEKAFDHGLVIETSGPNDEVVKCLAALTISENELVEGLDILEQAVEAVMADVIKAAA